MTVTNWNVPGATNGWGDAPHDTAAVGQGPHTEHEDSTGRRHYAPTEVSDTEVYQASEDPCAVAVNVANVVSVRMVPSVSGGFNTRILNAATDIILIAPPDPRRASMLVVSSQAMYIGTRAQVQQQLGALIPAGVGITLSSTTEIHAAGLPGNIYPQTIAIVTENWAY